MMTVCHSRARAVGLGALTLIAAMAGSTGVIVQAVAADDFGRHVVSCAQDVGLDGDHNPGMHPGRVGWDPSGVC